MKRTSLISGIIIWTIGCVAWSYFFGSGQAFVDRWGETHMVHTLSLSTPWYIYIPPIIIWYFFHWINMVNEWERRPVLLFGKYKGTYGPGLVLIEPLFYSILDDVPVQDVVIQVPVEHAQTKDNVGVSIIGLMTYRIDPERVRDAVVEVEDIDDAIQQRGFSTLADEVGKVDLDHLLEERDTFCEKIKAILSTRVAKWGPTIQAFELKSFQITDAEIANAISMKAKAQKEGDAEITRAEKQQQVAKALNEAADTYTEKGRWLKGMEVMIEMSRSAENNTVLIPTDLTAALTGLLKK